MAQDRPIKNGASPARSSGSLPHKWRSLTIVALAQIAAMSLWFVSAAILPEITAETNISAAVGAALSSVVQAGFVVGALVSAVLGLADRFDPRRLFLASALAAAAANAATLFVPVGGLEQIALRFVTGACMAGIYPVGMKIAVGWGQRDRGLLVGLLVGALTLGKSVPYLISWIGDDNWRLTVAMASVLATLAGIAILAVRLGPHHAHATFFDPRAIALAWTNRRVRLAYAGYLGHMWELYAFWAWVGGAAAASFALSLPESEATRLAKLTAFGAIALGGLACAPAGLLADRIGKARVAQAVMLASGSAALATALSFGGPVPLVVVLMLFWGLMVVPDSAQFSALVADAAPPDRAGSLLTFQTALGFGLTIFTVQITPRVADWMGWPLTLAALAIGPALGVEAMRRLITLGRATEGSDHSGG
jgi:MFS family permease